MRNEIVKANVPKIAIHARVATRTEAAQAGVICSLHFHEEMEFLPIQSGTFVCTTDGVDYTAKAGEVIFVGSGVPHETSALEDGTNSGLLQFRFRDFTDSEAERVVRYSARLRSAAEAPIRVLKDPVYYNTVNEILAEAEADHPGREMFLRAGIYRLLGMLFRDGILSDAEQMYRKKEVQKILPALEFLNEHYAERIDLISVSTKLGFDPSYFCRIFKAAVGATFTEYLNFVRISKAERRLVRTSDSILDIAIDVGIPSVSYFNRLFRKYHNCTPSYYRSAVYSNM